jgi:hypothetical protein
MRRADDNPRSAMLRKVDLYPQNNVHSNTNPFTKNASSTSNISSISSTSSVSNISNTSSNQQFKMSGPIQVRNIHSLSNSPIKEDIDDEWVQQVLTTSVGFGEGIDIMAEEDISFDLWGIYNDDCPHVKKSFDGFFRPSGRD